MEYERFGPFMLLEELGSGGMGPTYVARYEKNDRLVVVKVLAEDLRSDPKLIERFNRTTEVWRQQEHPNITRCYGCGVDAGRLYRVTQYVDGMSLKDIMSLRGKLNVEQAIHVGRQTTLALEYCHNAGILHLNLTLASSLVSSKGRLLLGGFGLARSIEREGTTAAGKTTGTPAYVAPEQIVGGGIGGHTDLYSLGHILYELLVGESVFAAVECNPMKWLMLFTQDAPHRVRETVPDCPPELDELIHRLLAKDPKDRPPNAVTVHKQLGEILDKLSNL